MENQFGQSDNEKIGGQQKISEYNKLRTAQYLHLRSRFFAKYPINHDCDFTLEDEIFNKLETLEYNLKTEEIAHQETLRAWRTLKNANP